MTDETGSPAGGEAFSVTELPADAPETFNSPQEAAAYLTSLKEKAPAERAEPATAEPELAQKADSAPETDPAEEPEEVEPAEEPPIEPPRSWTKAEKERFQSLPRETQEYLHTREQEREREFRRSQNEVAEQRKAFDAEREAVKQLRQQYEARLPDLAKTLEQALQNDFGDIRDLSDVRKLQMEDPFRFQQWQLRQLELAAAQKEQTEIQSRRHQEESSKWSEHTQAEGKKFQEALSDKDKVNLEKLMASAPTFLEDRGFTRQELTDLWNGKDRISLHDHRLQLLILDGMKFRDLQNAPKAVAAKPLPPVQKPGTSRPSGQGVNSERIQALNRKPELTVKEATELYELQQRSTRRAS